MAPLDGTGMTTTAYDTLRLERLHTAPTEGPRRPEAITARDWNAMSWHQRDRAARAHTKRRMARLASLEAERPALRAPEPVIGWYTPLVTTNQQVLSRLRVLICQIADTAPKPVVAPHGTNAARERHRYAGEEPCIDCQRSTIHAAPSDAEVQHMLRLAGQGYSNRQIGVATGRAHKTVGKYLRLAREGQL